MEKRIAREISSLEKKTSRVFYDTEKVCVYYKNSALRANIELYIKNYPFKCPEIYVNNYKYTNLLNYNVITETCLCCESVTCNDKWNLSLKLIDINNEIEKYLKLKNHVADLICLTNVLKHKALPREIEDQVLTYI